MTRRDYVLALLIVVIWGASFTAIRLGLDGVPPMLLAALRFLLVAFPAVLFVPRPTVPVRYWVAYGAAVGIGQFGCLFYAMHIGMPAGVASVVMQSQVFFTFILAGVLLQESVTGSQLAGLGIAALGLYLVGHSNGSTEIHSVPLAAFLLSLAAAASWGLSNIVVKQMSAVSRAQRTLSMFSVLIWSSLIPPIPLLLLALLLDTPTTIFESVTSLEGLSLFSLVYLAFGATLFGFGTWSKLISKYSPNTVAPLSLLVPVSGLLTARIVLDERLSATQWVGCAVVILGLGVTTFGLGAGLNPDEKVP